MAGVSKVICVISFLLKELDSCGGARWPRTEILDSISREPLTLANQSQSFALAHYLGELLSNFRSNLRRYFADLPLVWESPDNLAFEGEICFNGFTLFRTGSLAGTDRRWVPLIGMRGLRPLRKDPDISAGADVAFLRSGRGDLPVGRWRGQRSEEECWEVHLPTVIAWCRCAGAHPAGNHAWCSASEFSTTESGVWEG